MATDNLYEYIIVESYLPNSLSGLHGQIHIRPVKGQKHSQNLHVECSKSLANNFPIGTKFKLKVKLTAREGNGYFLYSYYNWPFEVL
jgi:hypothetical protein